MPHRTKRLLGLCALLLVVGAGCSSLNRMLRGAFQPPTAVFQSATLQGVSLQDATVAATFELVNPNPVGLSLGEIGYAFSLDGKRLFDGQMKQGLKLPSSGRTRVTVPVRVPFESVPGLFTTLASQKEAPYEVAGRLAFDTPVGRIGVPIKWAGVLPIPKLPQVSLSGVRMENVGLQGARFVVGLQVDNPNVFALPFQALQASLALAGQDVTTLGLTPNKPIEAQGKMSLDVPVDVSFAGLGTAVTSAVMQKKATVQLNGQAMLGGKSLPLSLQTTLR